ncbi:nucleoside triphosphate pyrophosphohydrolase [Ectobacillus antri]|jgi:predicted house-cleaning noncanonical NTP pyrophosphatase (MazG superfamily)|uniref:Nucleoside triphosphate pyrophosphohydrolase n=1 Tax=Ectobacillus antri TaxID=2486280 RepID=A0ABT6H9Z5_9BACI|nr:nucleoside triphosphate pyrophosphohydrolase [Ectobacillus antri]MDG4658527.1 nucleoside triphosphate pyrophosphohydrolase [Ectobacillus antri]MDG5755510.1 nucleoside triphosphate pyrophosphohydrolase [Ectobacillus antri]
MPTYNKLVRDKIPAVIERTGKAYTTRILDNEEYIEALRVKSQEELNEYLEAATNESALEELADLLEIIHALANYHGADIQDVERIRQEKADKRGGFMEKVFLIDVED